MQYKVLLVDDSRAVFEMLNLMMEESEFTIQAYCESGEAALAQYGDVQPDLVLMDIVMPGMSGLEASAMLKKQWPQARILLVSAWDDGSLDDEAKAIGCVGVYPKPFSYNSLLKAMREAVASKA